MKTKRIAIIVIACVSIALVSFVSYQKIEAAKAPDIEPAPCCSHEEDLAKNPDDCVFNNLMGVTDVDSMIVTQICENKLAADFYLDIPAKAQKSIDDGLEFLAAAQHSSGGWGAGYHSMQHITDPHAVAPDPATTAMVALAIIRDGSTFTSGPYSDQLNLAHVYLCSQVESTGDVQHTITELTGTQIQSKLGMSIDAILTTQYLSRALDIMEDQDLANRTQDCLQQCVTKIENTQAENGSFSGGTWAGVLNSSYANNALEAAYQWGVEMDDEVLEKSRQYQQDNYDVATGTGSVTDGAGVMLYSVSSSSRASATEAKKAKQLINEAKEKGELEEDAEINVDNLQKVGVTMDEAVQMDMASKVYESAKNVASTDQVMVGFGNNGGEEYLSYLQTGEGMIIGEDMAWQDWYIKVSQRMIDTQTENGSWQGHHCITSPVFCTATAVLILSINNDIDQLASIQ